MNNLQLLLRGGFYIAASSGKLFHPAINLKWFFFSCFETPNFENSCCLHLKEHSINKPSMKLHKCGKLNNVSRHKETDIWTGLGVKFFEGWEACLFCSDQNQSKNTAISLSSVRGHSHSSLPLCCSWRLLEADLGFHSHALTYPDLWNPLLFASPILQSPSSVSPHRNLWTSFVFSFTNKWCSLWSPVEQWSSGQVFAGEIQEQRILGSGPKQLRCDAFVIMGL